MSVYVLGIDQSTQGTKALLFDETGRPVARADLPHRQIIDERGWVEHDPEEIYRNTLQAVKNVVGKAGIDKGDIRVLGISNQRETALAWNRRSGKPLYNAVVWQCARGTEICARLEREHEGIAALIRSRTGLTYSPYFSAAKLAWILENVPQARAAEDAGELCMGTMDSFLVYRLTRSPQGTDDGFRACAGQDNDGERSVRMGRGGRFLTDYSNASRTQLFNIHTLRWDEEICDLFGIPVRCLPEVIDSDGDFGMTDFDGWLDRPIPIRCVMGDSHGALFGQNCRRPGRIKATYGTGSSIMMNIGEEPLTAEGLVTSLAWKIGGKVNYVLEGNINFTGAVITWMKDDLGLIRKASESEELARSANAGDRTYLVPAFSGLGAPYWDSGARALFCGMSRTTGRAELVKAGLESIAYQVTDILNIMRTESGIPMTELRADGGPAGNAYLMQFQSDLADIPVRVSEVEELSAFGVACAAGMAAGIYDPGSIFAGMRRREYVPRMQEAERQELLAGWKEAVGRALKHQN